MYTGPLVAHDLCWSSGPFISLEAGFGDDIVDDEDEEEEAVDDELEELEEVVVGARLFFEDFFFFLEWCFLERCLCLAAMMTKKP